MRVCKQALEYLPSTEFNRVVGNRMPRAEMEWEAERKSGWLWELHQTLISAKANLEIVNYDLISTMSQEDLPSLLLPGTYRECSANPESNSSLCFMLRELCEGFTFCLDGFPE